MPTATKAASVKPDLTLALRYTRNAAKAMLEMIETRQCEVRDRRIPIRSLAEARAVKLSKLNRHMLMMNALTPNPRSLEHKIAVATWTRVAKNIEKVRTMPDLRRIAGGAK